MPWNSLSSEPPLLLSGRVDPRVASLSSSLFSLQVKKIIERDVVDSHLLLKAAGTGCIGTWATAVEAAEAAGRSLLEEVNRAGMHERGHRPTRHSTSFVGSISCVRCW